MIANLSTAFLHRFILAYKLELRTYPKTRALKTVANKSNVVHDYSTLADMGTANRKLSDERSLSESRSRGSCENERRKPASVDSPTLSGSTIRNSSVDEISKAQHEQSPLLSPADSIYAGNYDDEERLVEDRAVLERDYDEFQETKSIWYLVLLTMSIGGLQIAWSVELSNGSPYLLSLGLSKSLMALVWIAGPITGSLVQPYIGIRSDNCRLKMGKRRPFMLAGAVATIVSFMALAWTREIVGGFLGWFGAAAESNLVKNSIIVVAVIFVYVLDFAINIGESNISCKSGCH